jgi:hypothetical protein
MIGNAESKSLNTQAITADREWIYAIAILFAAYFPVSMWLQATFVGTTPTGKVVVMLQRPFEKFGAVGAIARQWIPLDQVLDGADDAPNPQQSPVLLYEDDRLLGPPHCVHAEIMNVGQGRYSHWTNQGLVFSASDASNPNTNGRRYWAVVPWLPVSSAITICGIPLGAL